MAIHTAFTSGSGAVPVFTGKKDTDIWIPVLLVDKTDGITGETGIAYGSVDADYALASATSLTSYTVATADWKEIGEGMYALRIGAAEFTSTGRYFVRIGDTTPNAGKYVVAVEITENDLDDLADDLLSISSIPVFTAKEDVDTWIPVYLTDKSDGSTAITGLAHGNVDVDFGLASATSLTAYSPAAADWKEMGEGMYALRIGAAEFTAVGRYFVRVTGTGTNSGKYMFAVETNTSSIDDVASASINEIPNFSCKKATDTWVPVLLMSASDGVTPVTGVAYGSVDADFATGGATSLTSYTLATADWKEMGEGMYAIRIGAGEFSATGRYFLRVVDTSGNASKYFASIDVNESTIDDVVTNPNNVAVFSAKISTDTWVPVRLTSATDGKSGITGVAYGSIDVDYGLASATSYSAYSVSTDDWKEMGEGMYALRIGASEFGSLGRYIIRAVDTGATALKYMASVEITTVDVDSLVRSTTPANTLDVDANGLVDVSKFNGTAAVVENSLLSVNIASISEDNAAADTLEGIIEGSTQLTVDATKISGDSAAADNLELFTEQLSSGKIQASTFANNSITADVMAADAIGASELAADAVAEVADAVWDEATSGHTTGGTFGEQLKTDVDAILADTGTDGVKVDLTQAMGETHSDLTVGKALYLLYAHFAHKWTTSGGYSKVYKANNTDIFQTRTIASSTEISKGS
jgi:hypothetical protein